MAGRRHGTSGRSDFDKNEAMKGTVLYAFIEGQVADENNTYVGRTYRDAPNVDGYIFINTDEELLTGDIVRWKLPVRMNMT